MSLPGRAPRAALERGADHQAPATLCYTSFLLRVVADGRYERALAALLPCFSVYASAGDAAAARRAKLGGAVTRPADADAWIDLYASPSFHDAAARFAALVESAASAATPATLAAMESHFILSCHLENAFFTQALTLDEWPTYLAADADDA